MPVYRGKPIIAATTIAVLAGASAAALWSDAFESTQWLSATTKSISRLSTGNPVAAPKQVVPTPVRTTAVVLTDFPVRVRSIGIAEPQAVVSVKARIDSQLMQRHVADGQMVNAGDLLFVLDDKELRSHVAKDEANQKRDQALHTRAMADRSRKEELFSRNHATQMALDQARADEQAAAANLAAADAALAASRHRLTYTRIHAPISGRLGMIFVTEGNLVSANVTGLVTITQMQPIRVTFSLPERELGAVRVAIERKARPVVRTFTPGQEKAIATGLATFLDSSIHTVTGTVVVKAEFANTDLAMWPGQHVEIELDLDVREGLPTIPTVAIQTGQDGPFVYVVTEAGTLEIRKLTIAVSVARTTAVEAGLKQGERVVTDGHFKLRAGMRVEDAGEAT